MSKEKLALEVGMRGISYALRQKFKAALKKLKPTLPTEDGKFTPNLAQVGLNYLQEDELAGFVAGKKQDFKTYGMDEAERKSATLTYSPDKGGLFDSIGELANVKNRVYIVSKDGRLIYQPENIDSLFNHSSITRDGAVICAGMITVENGKIKSIDTDSGHYRPTHLDLYNALKVLKKQGDVFMDKCTIKNKNKKMNIGEFIDYMDEETSYQGKPMSRVDAMRQERIDAHESIGRKSIRIDGENLVEAILGTDFESQITSKTNSLTLPKSMFSSDYISEYAFKVFGEKGKEDKIKNLTLGVDEVVKHLSVSSDDKSVEAASKIILNFAEQTNTVREVDPLSLGDKDFKTKLSLKLLADDKFEESYVKLPHDQIGNLIISLPKERKQKVIGELIKRTDEQKSMRILLHCIFSSDEITSACVASALMSEDRFKNTYKKFRRFVSDIIDVLPEESREAAKKKVIRYEDEEASLSEAAKSASLHPQGSLKPSNTPSITNAQNKLER